MISTESSRVIALTLDQLSDERKFTILNRFNSSAKHSIIIEFADLNDIPLEAVVNTAHELKKKLLLYQDLKNLQGAVQKVLQLFLIKCLWMIHRNI